MARFHGEGGFSMLPSSYEKVLRLWILNLLVGLSAHRQFIEERGFSDDELSDFLGLKAFETGKPFNAQAARTALRQKHARVLLRPAVIPDDSSISHNLNWLSEMAGLSKVEGEILHLSVIQGQSPMLAKVLEMVGPLSLGAIQKLYSVVLGHPLAEISKALRSSGTLSRTGLLKIDHNRYTFAGKVEILTGLVDRLADEHQNPFDLFLGNFEVSPAPVLEPSHYEYLKDDVSLITAYLRQAMAERRSGVNILIHGLPGTGKSQLVRVISESLGYPLFEIATEDEDGDALKGETRFRSYRLSQAILNRSGGNLICFDEVEDVFRQRQEEHSYERGNQSGLKGWINRTLESNPVPAFWVTNNINIDPAFIRRFDFVLKMDIPPRSVRSKVLSQYLEGLAVETGTKNSLADHEQLTPAIVERATKVLRAVHTEDSLIDLGKVLSRIVGNTLEAQGVSREAKVSVQHQTTYRPELLNADCDLIELKAGLMKHGQGRLCLYGPAGSGKTAYGNHIAEALDRPLLVKRASDLQSKWVGGTEKNLAAMFQEAKQERAVLLLDESDSFLRERKDAERSWEISQVNEMLTQMETFDGVFIASTNLMDSLDSACLRRFDLKIEFRHLKPEGSWTLFQDTASSLGLEVGESDRHKLGRIRHLTPGDFANVMRQSRLQPIKSAAQLLDQLKAEVAMKPESRTKSLGF